MRFAFIFLLAGALTPAFAGTYYIAPTGKDSNPGTLEEPFASLQRAQAAVRQKPGAVFLRGGTYYLPDTLVFTAQDSGTKDAPVIFQNYQNEKPVISGGVKLENLDWQPYTNGIVQTKVADNLQTEEIFVNGERQILARYPNFDPTAKYFDGYAADAISSNRVARWADPTGGYFHAMHPSLWGDFTWRITGKDADNKLTMEGGWQNNRGAAAHRQIRFVENIFRGIGLVRRMVSQPQDAHAVFLSARRSRFKNRDGGSDATAQPGRVSWQRNTAGEIHHAARNCFSPGGAHGDGHERAAGAFGLGDLSRRRDFFQRRGRLHAGGQLH